MNQIKNKVNWFIFTFGVFVLYGIGYLIFGEIHPFSRYPMYSSFPNWSYVFYITDKHDKIIPFETMNIYGAEVSHLYYFISEDLQILCGNFQESKEDLDLLGTKMIEIIKVQTDFDHPFIKLYRCGYYLENDSIIRIDQLMTIIDYEDPI